MTNLLIIKNGSLIIVRFIEGNSVSFSIDFNDKIIPVYHNGGQYNAVFKNNTTLLLMYYKIGSSDYWFVVGGPSVENTKNVLAKSSNGNLEINNLENGHVYLNHINDSEVTSSHLIKGENGISVTASNGEISITAPDIPDITVKKFSS